MRYELSDDEWMRRRDARLNLLNDVVGDGEQLVRHINGYRECIVPDFRYGRIVQSRDFPRHSRRVIADCVPLSGGISVCYCRRNAFSVDSHAPGVLHG
jgi:hypothetical protein